MTDWLNKKIVVYFAIIGINFLFIFSLANATTIASVDFDGRTVSGATASNLNWTLNGLNDPGNLTAIAYSPDVPAAGLFTTSDANDIFAVNRNLAQEGPWSVDIALDVLGTNDIALNDITLDAYILNNDGNFQTVERQLDLNLSLYSSASVLLYSVDELDVYQDLQPNSPASQPKEVSFGFSGNTLLANENYYFKLTASGGNLGNNAAIDNLIITGDLNNPVPEPTTILLFGFGLLGLARVSRRKE